jgi:polyhydroxybutyrate depolymerase
VPAISGGRPSPLLLAFHGGGGEAEGFERYAGLDAVSDREGFVVAYPNGTGPLRNRLLTWNAGEGCCGWAREHAVDDVGFAIAVIDDLAGRLPIDRRRVYATGHSNGAMMSHRLGAERADRIAAVAPVAGALDLSRIAPSRAMPVLDIHSVDDPRALYDGGLGPPFPLTDQRVTHRPVETGLAQWRAANGCTGETRTETVRTGQAGSVNDGQTATKFVWEPCTGGAVVAQWKLTGVGHSWPGSARGELPERLIGRPTTLVSAAEEVWAFVSRFSLPPP